MLEGVIGEERKMHESLKKYKREGDEEKVGSDFEKMMVQYYIVRIQRIREYRI